MLRSIDLLRPLLVSIAAILVSVACHVEHLVVTSPTDDAGAGAGDGFDAAPPEGVSCATSGTSCSCAITSSPNTTSCSSATGDLCCASSDWPASGSCACTAPTEQVYCGVVPGYFTGGVSGCICSTTQAESGQKVGATCYPGATTSPGGTGLCCLMANGDCACEAGSFTKCYGGAPIVPSCDAAALGVKKPTCPAGKVEVSACSSAGSSSSGSSGTSGSTSSSGSTTSSSGSTTSSSGSTCLADGDHCGTNGDCCKGYCNKGNYECGCAKAGTDFYNGGACTEQKGCCTGLCILPSSGTTGYCCAQQDVGNGVILGKPPGSTCTGNGECCSQVCNAVYHTCY